MSTLRGIKVGDALTCTRRWMERVDFVWTKSVVKVTAKRAYLDAYQWVALDDDKREVHPKYINYTTTAEKAVAA